MHGSPFFVMAEMAIPDAGQCIDWAAPFLVLAAAVCVLRRMDLIIDHLFPHWDWEKRLGWLNITAHRRAEQIDIQTFVREHGNAPGRQSWMTPS